MVSIGALSFPRKPKLTEQLFKVGKSKIKSQLKTSHLLACMVCVKGRPRVNLSDWPLALKTMWFKMKKNRIYLKHLKSVFIWNRCESFRNEGKSMIVNVYCEAAQKRRLRAGSQNLNDVKHLT